MKFSFKYLILFVAAFCIMALNVKADSDDDYLGDLVIECEAVSKDNIPSSSYVIGKHVFTRNSNANYGGQLTTQLIMMASKTIGSYSIDAMQIFYKNPRGNWINGITGASISVPNEFDVCFTDNQLSFDPQLGDPTIQTLGDSSWDYIPSYEYLGDGISNYPYTISGVEINYSVLGSDETYVTYDYSPYMYMDENTVEYYFSVPVPVGYYYTYNIRTFIEIYGTRVYSNYSNDLSRDYTLPTPTIEPLLGDCDGDECLLGDTYFEYVQGFDGIEVYLADSYNNHPFSWNKDVLIQDMSHIYRDNMPEDLYSFDSGISGLCGVSYKIRTFKYINSEAVYSPFSNALETNPC